MADIVQLKENGVPKYLKTHIQAVDGLKEKHEEIDRKIQDGIEAAGSDMLNEIIRRSPQILELTIADQTITNSTAEVTKLGGFRAQINTDPTRFLADTSALYISKSGTYTVDVTCSINNKGVGTYFGLQVKQTNGDQSFPGPALKAWAGDKSQVIISGSTKFDAGDQLGLFTYPANAKYEINNLRIRLTYWGDDSQ